MSNCKLDECLRGKNGSYIRPLIWYAGESIESLVNEIHAVKSAGVDEFILENRGGDWFGTDFWWKLMQTALDTAESLNMRMWILDDSHVNTGSANDSLKKEENAKFRAVNLRVEAVDFAGPVMAGALLLPNRTAGEEIIRVSAYRRDENSGHCIGDAVDLTDRICDGLCAADFGEGIWRVYFVLTAASARQGLFADYITMVSKESCRHLIDEVHEKIYQHFAPYFGNVFAGFFSDEPAFGNCDGQYGYDSCDHRMGQLRRIYPWWDDFPEKIAAEADMSVEEVMLNLPALWDNVDEKSPVLRVAYMNVITKAWQENFSCQIGKWCEEHNVEYIGHNLEDRGAHMHTGWGCGHYFRSMAGQHMAGLDIVLNQHVPGIRSINHAANTSNKEYNSDFYNYTLPKLGPSLAHVMPHMKNRSNCEVFGAYGWTCGLVMMRAIFNLFMANGVNNFMPHAFSMNLPGNCRTDNDGIVPPGFCLSKLPPTFYMGGMNPQYRIFGKLMRYVQRICHLLSDGTHIADAAVYYNAEADWINGKFRNIDDVAMALARGGIDYDFIPSDIICGNCCVKDGRLHVNGETYKMLIVPESQIMPEKLLSAFRDLAEQGLKVIFTDELPQYCEYSNISIAEYNACFSAIPLAEIASEIKRMTDCAVELKEPCDALRFHALAKNDGSRCTLFFNDSIREIDVQIKIPSAGKCIIYDAWDNRVFAPQIQDGYMRLKLASQQLLTVIFNASFDGDITDFVYDLQMNELDIDYDIFIKNHDENEFKLLRSQSKAVNLLVEEKLTRCCAEFRYDGVFEADSDGFSFIEIPYSGDCAELWLNGEYCGAELGPSARFDIRGKINKGSNSISILTADNPSYFDREVKQGLLYGTKIPAMMHGIYGNIKIG